MGRTSGLVIIAALAGSVAAAASAAPAPPAPAAASAADPIGADIRCLLIATSMASSDQPQAQSTGGIATFYYLGRLEGRITDAALEDRMLSEIPTLQRGAQAEAERCAQAIRARNAGYQALGDRLEKRLGPPPGAAPKPPAAAPQAPTALPPKS